MGSMSIIEGNELLLRHLTKQDLKDFTAVLTNPLYGKFSPLGKITESLAGDLLDNIVKQYDLNRYEFWVVVDKTHKTIAGFVGYHPIVFEDKLHEMYFVGFYPKFWGSKFPEMATKYVCHYAFSQDKLNRLLVLVHPEDTAALMCTQIVEAEFIKEALFFGVKMFMFMIENKSFQKFNLSNQISIK